MTRNITRLAAVSLLGALGTVAQASTLGLTAAGGSEAVLTLVDTADNSSVSQDLGDQIGQLAIGDAFNLGASVLSFISNAGGLGNIRFSVIAGQAANGTSAATYLHSSDNAALSSIANSVRGTWFSAAGAFITGPQGLNSTLPADVDGNVDQVYGPFAAGTTNRNYLAGTGTDFMADWGTAGTCTGNDNVCNLVNGTLRAQLFLVNFGTGATSFASLQRFLNDGLNGGATAVLDLPSGRLRIASVVPVPAAVWLLGSAVGLLGIVRRRQRG
jgi:hypothetical protein